MRPSRTWIVDPIDGTISFASGIPFFSVSIALAVDTDILLGVLVDPMRRDLYVGIDQGEAHLVTNLPRIGGAADEPMGGDGAQSFVMTPRRLALTRDAVVSLDPGDPDDPVAIDRVNLVRRRVRAVRTMGSTALSLCWAACGRLDGVMQVRGLEAVDLAAAGLIAREAGLRVTDASGGPWLDLRQTSHGRGIAAGRAAVHRLLLGH